MQDVFEIIGTTRAMRRLKPDPVGDLEHLIGNASDGRDAAVLVQYLLGIAEQMILLGAVMAGIAAAVGAFDAQSAGVVVGRYEIIERPR